MRVLPSDMNEVVALEIDVDYSGGAMLDIETRLEVREEDFQDVINTNLESSSAEGVTPHIIEGIEYLGQQLKLPEGTGDEIEQKDRDPKLGIPHSVLYLRFDACVEYKAFIHNFSGQT